MQATARAHPNIALIKYWGKRDTERNLPAVDSLSLTLDSLYTETTVRFDATFAEDGFLLNGRPQPAALQRVTACLDRVAGPGRLRAEVDSRANFPVAAGLASSASAFAALTLAAASAAGKQYSRPELANLAGAASGSAARSLYAGYVLLRNEGDAVSVETILEEQAWPLRVVAAVTTTQPKPLSSGAAMESSRLSSPFYQRWLDEQPGDIQAARDAIAQRDFAALAGIAEHNCLKMHSVMWASRPPVVYWSPATVNCLETVRRLQASGSAVFFTIDAGPQVKAICTPSAESDVAAALRQTDGVESVLQSGLGAGARLLEAH